ncbi:MAG: hypothetical protein L0Z53_08615, partial [Acidobacteriales bacterium]|nr:hypothetical protein [Terriglobales bacterium]
MKHLLHCLTVLLLLIQTCVGAPLDGGLILKGDVVTMDSQLNVITDGRVVILKEKILAVLKPADPMPPGFNAATAVTIDT